MTPKSYLNFISGYKNIYQNKQKELGDGALRMDTGLAKLDEASQSVEILKQDLAVMERELAQASQKVCVLLCLKIWVAVTQITFYLFYKV